MDTPASFITCRGGDVPVFQMMSTFLGTYYILYGIFYMASFITCHGGDVPVFQMMCTFLGTYYILYLCITSL